MKLIRSLILSCWCLVPGLSTAQAQTGQIGIDYSAQLERATLDGIRLIAVTPGSPAAQAGLRPGDLILMINGQGARADSFNPGQPTRRAGSTLDLMVLRDGNVLPMRLTVAPAPGGEPPTQPPPAPSPAPPQAEPRNPTTAPSGFAVGRVTLPDGSPLPPAVEEVRIWIVGVSSAGRNVTYEPQVGANGTYRQALAEGEYRFSTAYVKVRHGGKVFEVRLEPVGDLATKSRNASAGIVQDFVWKATGPTPRALALGPDPGNHTHWYGSRLSTSAGGWRGDFDEQGGRVNRGRADRLIPEGTRVSLTLRPLTAALDARLLSPVTIERLVNWNVSSHFHDLPPADYELTGVATLPDGRQTPLTFRGSEENRLGFVRTPRINLAWDTTLSHYLDRGLTYYLEEVAVAPTVAVAPAPLLQLSNLAPGSKVTVLWSGSWYPATIKAVRGPEQWLIGYDGFGTSWDEVVGSDRIRPAAAPPPAPAAATPPATPAPAPAPNLTWPAQPPGAVTPIEGAYMTVRSWMSGGVTIEAWFFTRNGRFSRSPSGGINLAALATKPQPSRHEGTYRVENGRLLLAWADGREAWDSPYQGHQESLSLGGQFASRRTGFPPGWRFNGTYEGGASVGGGAVSSSNTLVFRADGTFSRSGIVNFTSVGRTSEVSGGATNASQGTYDFEEFILILRENGTETRSTVLSFGSTNEAGLPEQIYREGGMMRRQ
jgi:hypothetical protein